MILKPGFHYTYISVTSNTVAVTVSRTRLLTSIALVATPTLAVKSLKHTSVIMPPRCEPQRAAQEPPKPQSVPTYAAATAVSSLAAAAAAAAAAVTNPTLAEASGSVGGTDGPAIGGNTGARIPTAISNSDPKTNITSEHNTNVADLTVSNDMDTRAAASAKRSAESPSCIIEEADSKKTRDSAATAMDTVSDAANWDIFAPPDDPMWPDETKKLSTRLNDKHYDRIMDGFSEEQRKLARKKFEGVSKQVGPGADTSHYLVHQMPDLLGGIAQILMERELTIDEHSLPLDTWYRGFTKLAHRTFTATDYFTEEDILECRILMCRLAHTNPGPIWDMRKRLMHAAVEATAWAGCVRAVGTLYAHSPPPAKGSLKDSGKITNYLLPSQQKVPQGATPLLVKRSAVAQTPSPLTPVAASPAPASASAASILTSTQKTPSPKSALKTPTHPHPSATLQLAQAVTRVLRRNCEFLGKFRISTESAPGQIPALVLMDLLKDLLIVYCALDSAAVLVTWIQQWLVLTQSYPQRVPSLSARLQRAC